MAVFYNGNTMGVVYIEQQGGGGEKPRKYKIQIRQGNCLAVFMHIYKFKNLEDPKKWLTQELTLCTTLKMQGISFISQQKGYRIVPDATVRFEDGESIYYLYKVED